MTTYSPQQLAQYILSRQASFKPKVGIILGSGLANFANELRNPLSIPYSTLPNFPVSQVQGHPGKLILGYIREVPVICYQGRIHAYEGMQGKDFKLFIRTLKCLGCEVLLMTNAVGSLRSDFQPGQLVLISDHINFQLTNPLIGPNEDKFGPRFFAMDKAYDESLRHLLQKTARQLHFILPEGIYLSVLGPSFETPAEIRAFQRLGADVVGMSTVPEVIVAKHCGLKVAVISVVTNLASGLSAESITHEDTLRIAKEASDTLNKLLNHAISSLKSTTLSS